MDINKDVVNNKMKENSNKVQFSLNHNESETSLGQDLDNFYEVSHNHIENTKREAEKRYLKWHRVMSIVNYFIEKYLQIIVQYYC